MEGSRGSDSAGLLSLPTDPFAGVLQGDAERRQSIPNSVRGCEVFPLSGVLAEPDDEVHHAVEEIRAERTYLEEPQYVADSLEQGRGLAEGVSPGAVLDRFVQNPGILEEDRDGLARVEVVRHRCIEVREGGLRCHSNAGVRLPLLGGATAFRVDGADRFLEAFVRSFGLVDRG